MMTTTATAVIAMLSCAGAASAAGELNIYNWGDYTNPELIKKLSDMGMNAQGSTPAQFQALIDRDTKAYADIAQRAKISLDR